ncbi:MAG: nucleoside-diphosphate kinase [Bacillota bacterium]|nr:MAG: nucleoside-diphosphate kinase [Bacillota bacterium]MBS3950087.1 nucleoside-diphosphate kinase [Peptococcaceae bacterium]
MERTLCLIKPDGVQRYLIGEVINRIERKGLQIVGLKMLVLSPELAAQHYAEHVSKPFYSKLVEYITSGPIVALCVQGHRSVTVLRSILGKTDPAEAAPGTIRGDLGLTKGRNIVHASDSVEAAEKEIRLYFNNSELISSKLALLDWIFRED